MITQGRGVPANAGRDYSPASRVLWLVLLALLLVLGQVSCGGAADQEPGMPEPTEASAAEPAEEEPEVTEEAPESAEASPTPLGTATLSPRTPTPAGTPSSDEELELTGGTDVRETDRLGEVTADYPARMSPGSSDIVRLAIQIPDRLVSLAPMSVERVVLPEGSPAVIGEVASDQATILIHPMMRVELDSPTVQVSAEYPAVQAVDVETIGNPTFWAWTVVAPEEPGNHILTVKVYLGEESEAPSWLRAYQVEVLDFSPTPAPTREPTSTPVDTPTAEPTPTFTPAPTATPSLPERIKQGVVENAGEIFISVVSVLLSGLAWLATAGYRAGKRRKARIAALRKELAGAAEEDQDELAAEIADLEATRWWQFWKWDD